MTIRTVHWTEDAYNCHQMGSFDERGQFKPACLACPIYALPLDSFERDYPRRPFCGIAALMPTILNRLGEPRVTENSHGQKVIIGSKELVYNDIHATVLDLIKQQPGVTISDLIDMLNMQYNTIESVLKRGLANGYIRSVKVKRRKDGRNYSINEYYWKDADQSAVS